MIKTDLPNWVAKYVRQAFTGDCWDLVATIQREVFGIASRRREVSGWNRVEKPREGDVIAITIGGKPSHIGVVCAEGFFVHLLKNKSVVCSRYNSNLYRARIHGFFRHESRLP